MENEKRRKRLIRCIGRLNDGVDVALRDMKSALLAEQFTAFKSEWAAQVEQRSEAKEKPDAVVEYETRFKAAQFAYSKAEGFNGSNSRKPKKGKDGLYTHQSLFQTSQLMFEELVEYLREQLVGNPSLELWFDRSVDDLAVGLTPEDVPRVVTSRSANKRGDGLLNGRRSKRDIKLSALQNALAELAEEDRLAGLSSVEVTAEKLQAAKSRMQLEELRNIARSRW